MSAFFFLCSFVMNLGKDATLLGLHFNPRFDAHGDVNTIVCNSKKVEEWGAEHREAVFPFQKGGTAEVRHAYIYICIYALSTRSGEGRVFGTGHPAARAVSGLSVLEVAGFSCLASATTQGSEL